MGLMQGLVEDQVASMDRAPRIMLSAGAGMTRPV